MVRFGCKVPTGRVVRLDDVPLQDLQAIAVAAGQESWFDIYLQPARYGDAAVAIYRHCCEMVGVEPIDPVTPGIVLDCFVQVDEDLPTLWESEGDGPSVPPKADDQTTP